jgi:hypothetical protein
MREALPEVGVPRVEVRVEVDKSQRAVSAMVWSPPMASKRPPPSKSASAATSIWATASSALNGVQAMSPASTTWASSKGRASSAGL